MEKVILGVETSCDETSASIVIVKNNKTKVLSNIVSSQVDIHKKYGGVVPEVASRAHVEVIIPVVKEALLKAKKRLKDIDSIAVTSNPGLIGSLSVGLAFSKALSYILNRKCYFINHLEGHIYANFINNINIKFPAAVLVVSGGHTQIILMKSHCRYEVLGQTKDDAAGEAFDKVARLLGFDYPGGPSIEKIALSGNGNKFLFPRAEMEGKTGRDKNGFVVKILPNLDFSFSGLKTAVLLEIKKHKRISKKDKSDIAAGFQKAVVDVLVQKTIWAAERNKVQSILLSGGVSANRKLREELRSESEDNGFSFYVPDISFSTDNAAMIAVVSYFKHLRK